MAQVAAHEDEGVGAGGCAGEAGEVTDGMAWGAVEVERTVTKEVEGLKGASLDVLCAKVDFPKGASSVCSG